MNCRPKAYESSALPLSYPGFADRPNPDMLRYVVAKGCVAVDGISLTVAEVDDAGFSIWLIPHTLEVTNLQDKRTGDRVNLEFDMLAKYVEKSFWPRASRTMGRSRVVRISEKQNNRVQEEAGGRQNN